MYAAPKSKPSIRPNNLSASSRCAREFSAAPRAEFRHRKLLCRRVRRVRDPILSGRRTPGRKKEDDRADKGVRIRARAAPRGRPGARAAELRAADHWGVVFQSAAARWPGRGYRTAGAGGLGRVTVERLAVNVRTREAREREREQLQRENNCKVWFMVHDHPLFWLGHNFPAEEATSDQ